MVNATANIEPVDVQPSRSGQGNLSRPEAPSILRTFRYLLTLAFVGCLILPGLAYITSPTDSGVISPADETFLKVAEISSILVMAFLGNAIVRRLGLTSPYLAYLFLFASLAVGWWVAQAGGLPSTTGGKLGTAVVLTCPLFFSGIVFSTILSAQSRISSVMCLNLLGAMCGGILEYNSMYFGFHFLYVLATGLYAAALLSGVTLRSKNALSPLGQH